VLILDEATSRLDPATEQALALATGQLLSGRTALVVAHRLSTVKRADRILVLADGRVLEYGSRQSLALDPTSQYSQWLRLANPEDLLA
jgi:ATP-binding cassette subfamily B protein/ATP-binding cassette subfamily C protein